MIDTWYYPLYASFVLGRCDLGDENHQTSEKKFCPNRAGIKKNQQHSREFLINSSSSVIGIGGRSR
jgi:hypothetical protein